jgi:23S rRNA-/tRNA-specific pseudouridylate synthase
LVENKAHVVYSTTDTTNGKLSHTAYRALSETKGLSLLEVNPVTGRKNQMRVYLAVIGHPIVGDKQHGKGNKSHTCLALHGRSISFTHPFSGKQLTFEAEVPSYFRKLVGRMDRKDGPRRPSTPDPEPH